MNPLEILQRNNNMQVSRYADLKIRSLEVLEGVTFVEFYACTYNQLYSIFLDDDSIKEMILPGAFDEWLADPTGFERVVHLLDHRDTCGIVQSIRSDDKGLIVRSALLAGQGNEYGDIALSHYATANKLEKSVKHSIGFMRFSDDTSDYYYDKTLDCFILKRGKLFDVSTVTKWAANPNAIDLKRTLEMSDTQKNEQNKWEFLNNLTINL